MYLKVYYDGYGYNFYYGEYNYYEYSVNPGSADGFMTVIYVILLICFSGCKQCLGSMADRAESTVVETVVETKTETVEQKMEQTENTGFDPNVPQGPYNHKF